MTRTVCPECFEGVHGECIGQGCYCDCQLGEPNNVGLIIYVEATKLAMNLGQTVGPKNEYYVTLRQLEEICKEKLAND